MQPIFTTGFSLTILVAVPTLAIAAPASLAQASNPQIAGTSDRSDVPLTSARPPSLIERITAGKQAEKQWRQAVEENPKNAEAYRNLADALTTLSRDRDAEAIYQRAIQLDLKDEASYLAFGEFLQTQSRPYDEAVLYQQMVEILPESAIAHERFADSLTRVAPEDWPHENWPSLDAEIKAAYRQAIQLEPSQTMAYYGLGAYLVRQGRFAEAMSTLRDIIRFDPDDKDIYATLAALSARNGDLTAAAAVYQEGLAAQPNNLELYVSYANWLLSQNRNAAAAALYQAAIDQGVSGEFKAYVQLGDILVSQGRSAEAKAVYERAIMLSPNPDTYGRLGKLLESTEGAAATIALYQQAIQKPRVEDKGYFYNQIGRLLKASGQTDEAIATYRQALSITDSPNSAGPLAELLLEQQQYDEVLSLYKRFRLVFGKDERALENWQAALRGLGRTAEADTLPQDIQIQMAADNEAIYRRAIAISPESGYFYDALGDALLQQSKADKAEAAYQEALRLNYGTFRTRVKLGKALFAQGKLEEAESVYQQALALSPQKNRQHFLQDQNRLYQNLGELYEATARPVLALKSYQNALKIDPFQVSVEGKIAELSAKSSGDRTIDAVSTEADAGQAAP